MKGFRLFRSIQVKLITMVLLLILIAVQLIGVYFISTMKSSLINSFTSNLEVQANLLTNYAAQAMSKTDKGEDGKETSTNEDLNALVANLFTISAAEI